MKNQGRKIRKLGRCSFGHEGCSSLTLHSIAMHYRVVREDMRDGIVIPTTSVVSSISDCIVETIEGVEITKGSIHAERQEGLK